MCQDRLLNDESLMVTPQELAPLMAEFGKGFTRRIYAQMACAGTTPARAKLLMTLSCHGNCKMSEISGHLGVTPRNVTKLVDRLEEEGLVAREPHPEDRRATIIRLTPQGVLMSKETMLANHAAIEELFEQLSPSDRQHLSRILKRLIAALANAPE